MALRHAGSIRRADGYRPPIGSACARPIDWPRDMVSYCRYRETPGPERPD